MGPNTDSIENAIAELEHHDPAARLKARQILVEHGAVALPVVRQALSEPETLSATFYQELVRVLNWINYGDDPEKLYELIEGVDPRRLAHGNMFGGAEAAIQNAPQFQEFTRIGKRVLPFLEATVANQENSYSLRAAAATLLKTIGAASNAPVLIGELEREHSLIVQTGLESIKLDEHYRGFFIFSLHHALTILTGENFTLGLLQTMSGQPEVFYEVGLSGNTIRRWRDWWEKMKPEIEGEDDSPRTLPTNDVDQLLDKLVTSANGRSSHARYALNRLGSEADTRIVEFARAHSDTDAAVVLTEMLIQNGRGLAFPEDQHTAQLIAGWLGSLDHIILLRAAINRAYADLPVSTLRAIAIVFATHALSDKYPHFFDPYTSTHLDTVGLRSKEVSEGAVKEIIAGVRSNDEATRRLFFDIARQAAVQITINEKTGEAPVHASKFADGLSEIRNTFTSYDDRVATFEILQKLGRTPDLDEVLTLLNETPTEANSESVADLVEALSNVGVPEAKRPAAMSTLFMLVRSRPAIARSVLSTLARLAPKHFEYNPLIGDRGTCALVNIYELTNDPNIAADKTKLGESLQELRNDVIKHAQKTQTFERYLGFSALKVCTQLARQFDLPAELYDSLTMQAVILAQTEPIEYPNIAEVDNQLKPLLGAPNKYLEYLKSLENGVTPSTYDVSAALFEEAARVAAEKGLDRGKIVLARLSVADMARKSKHYEHAEQLYLTIDLQETDSFYFVARQKHFLAELLVEQGRWADACDVALELRNLYSHQKEKTAEDWHFFCDTYLHEFLSWCRFQNINQALRSVASLSTNYQRLGILQHQAEVQIEAASIYGRIGRHEEAEQQFQNLREFLADKPPVYPTLVIALRRDATYQLERGKADAAADLLDKAVLLCEKMPILESRAYEKVAELYWLLGCAHLMRHDLQAANQAQLQLEGWHSPLARAYRARLQAMIEASSGSIAAAISTLEPALDLSFGKSYPDLRAELCLDLADLLLREGFYDRCFEVLERAHHVAAESRNFFIMTNVQIMMAQLFESAGDSEQASAIYRDVINNPQATQVLDLVAVASMNILLLLATKEGNINLANDVAGIAKSLRSIRDLRWRISLLQRFARLYLSNQRLENVEAILDVLDENIKGGISMNVLLECKMLRGEAARLHGDSANAVRYFREAVHMLEVGHESVLERGLGTGLFVSKDSPYRALVQSLVEDNKPSEALHYVERAKTRLFLDQIHWRTIKSHAETDPVVRYVQILKRLAFLELDTTDLNRNTDERLGLEKELERLRAEIPEKDLIAAVHPALGRPEEMQHDLKAVMRT